jgi:hypothetical protein
VTVVRIGTWNMQGRWTAAHAALLQTLACDVWLLTEVNARLEMPTCHRYATSALMAPGRFWAAVMTRSRAEQLPEPHAASATVSLDGATYCSSVLPWRSCGQRSPWIGERHVDKTRAALTSIDEGLPAGPLVWGGDWNHALDGKEYAGSNGGRDAIADLLIRRQLHVPTADLPHRIPGLLSIDHIALTRHIRVTQAKRIGAGGLSDHDGYLVEVDPL